MWPDRVSNPGPLTYESGAIPTARHGPALLVEDLLSFLGHIKSCMQLIFAEKKN